jgi:phenylalanyl-tRNA synthetase beta chain
MLYSYGWIRQFLSKTPAVEDIANRLTVSGLEVESVKRTYTDINGIITAKVRDIRPHPSAGDLHIVDVSTGNNTFTTVTGAAIHVSGYPSGGTSGMMRDMIVAYAPNGASIANNKIITDADIKGQRSTGMIISEDELGIPGSLREIVTFDPSTPPGSDVKTLLGLDDQIIEVAVTPNRPDVLSHFGLAREIATLFRLKVISPFYELHEKKYGKPDAAFKVKIESPHDCPRYTLRLIAGVHIMPSPLWLRIALGKLEQKSINNVVDITNYVMFALGQPLHAFDKEKIKGNTIVVRRGRNENLVTLDDQERLLSDRTLVIADQEKPVAIAGVMGGRSSGVTEHTKDILLESAVFEPSVVRGTERRLGLLTEADYRFERGVDRCVSKTASDYAAYLISQITGASVYRPVDSFPGRPRKRNIVVSMDTLKTVIGFSLNIKKTQSLLRSVYCNVRRIRAKTLSVEPPSFRLDLVQAVDLAEEIARLIGYERIPSLLPLRESRNVPVPSDYTYTGCIRDHLVSMGFDEVINYSFYSEDDHAVAGGEAIKLSNPLNDQTMLMRTSLVPALIKNAQYNLFRQVEHQKLFEAGKVYFKTGDRYGERFHITGLLTGMRYPYQWSFPHERVDLFDAVGAVKGIFDALKLGNSLDVGPGSVDFLVPGNAVKLKHKGAPVGFAGEISKNILNRYDINQQIFIFDIAVGPLLPDASAYTKYSDVPRYPFVARDLTVVKPVMILSSDIVSGIRSLNIPILVEIFPFDLYVDKNDISDNVLLHSVTYRFIFRSEDRTLKDEEVDQYMKVIMDYVKSNYNVKLKV